jgi:hypothetical protein
MRVQRLRLSQVVKCILSGHAHSWVWLHAGCWVGECWMHWDKCEGEGWLLKVPTCHGSGDEELRTDLFWREGL